MRKIFYKLNLLFENGKTLPITIATADINRIPELINKNRIVYTTTSGANITGHPIIDTRYTVSLTDEEYEAELMYCDIVDE